MTVAHRKLTQPHQQCWLSLLLESFTTSRTPPPADDYNVDDKEGIDEDALLGDGDGAEGGEAPEYEVRDEVGPSEDEEDSPTDP